MSIMSSDLIETLQSVLNSINNPAYIKKDNAIIAHNDLFETKYLSPKYLQNYNLTVKQSCLNDNMQLNEIISNDVYRLAESNKKLVQAMGLL